MTLKQDIRALWQKFADDDCAGLAAEMAFHMMVSFIPAAALVISLTGLIGSKPEILLGMLAFSHRIFPPDVLSLLQDLLVNIITGSSEGFAVVTFGITLWAASSGAMAVLKGLNRVYGFAWRGKRLYLNQQLTAMLLVILTGITLFLAANAIVLGDFLLAQLDRLSTLKAFDLLIISVLRWIAAIALTVLLTAYTYAVAPGPGNIRYPIRCTLPGASVFVVFWLALSIFFGWYVEYIGRYNQVYGSLTGVIALMIWFYLSSLAFLAGAEISAFHCRENVESKKCS